jgi:plasmid replication initiation protein
MIRSRFYNPQFDLFLPTIVDLKFRDQKDTMERPFFSLSKSKRMKPIEYVNENDGIFVTVQPHQDYGMATIWDADVLIWAASVLCDMKNRGTNDIPRELKVPAARCCSKPSGAQRAARTTRSCVTRWSG